MNFGRAVKTVFLKCADTRGRARRSEYWYFFMLNALVCVAAFVLCAITKKAEWLLILLFYCFVMLFPNLTVAIRRLHDTGKSGWFLFFGLIPVVGHVVLLIWLCEDSEPCTNKYGSNPKNRTEIEELLETSKYYKEEDVPEATKQVKMLRYIAKKAFKISIIGMCTILAIAVLYMIIVIISNLIK